MKKRGNHQNITFSLVFCAILGLLAWVSLHHQVYLNAQNQGDTETEVNEPPSTQLLPPIEKNVHVAGGDTSHDLKLARAEQKLYQAHKALSQKDQEQADRLFDSAFSSYLSLRQEAFQWEADKEPLVRLYNLARSSFLQEASGEVWRPLLDCINLWFSFFPARYQMDLEKRDRIEAERAFVHAQKQIKAQQTLTLRELSRRYFYTSYGLKALDLLAQKAFERGNFLEIVALYLPLQETRLKAYLANPLRHFYVLLAFQALGEHELLTPALELAQEHFHTTKIFVGEQSLNFQEAYEQASKDLLKNVKSSNEGIIPDIQRLGSPTRLPLLTSQEQLAEIELENDDQTLFFRQANFYRQGLLIHRDKNSLFWYPNLESSEFRWLQQSKEAKARYIQPKKDERYTYWYPSYHERTEPELLHVGLSQEHSSPWENQGFQTSKQELSPRAAAIFGNGSNESGPFTGNQVHVFDLEREGSLLHVLPHPDDLPQGDEEQKDNPQALSLSKTAFSGKPFILQDTLYVLGSVSLQSSSEVYLHAFNISLKGEEAGRLMWRKKLSAIQGRLEAWGESSSELIKGASMQLLGERLFIATNSGILTCLNRHDGYSYWFIKYQSRDRGAIGGWSRRLKSNWGEPLLSSNFFLSGTTAFAAPTDAKHALAFNIYDGYLLQSLFKYGNEYKQFRFCLGVAGGYAYCQSAEGILKAEAVSYRKEVLNAEGKKAYGPSLTSQELPPEYTSAYNAWGRGLITKSEILLPSHTGLLRFDRFSLEFKDQLPWPEKSALSASEKAGGFKPINQRERDKNALPTSIVYWSGLLPSNDQRQDYLVKIEPSQISFYPIAR